MYKPHKQDHIKQELKLIESISYKTFVDKFEVKSLLNCSEKTAERRIKHLGFKHTSLKIIEMLKNLKMENLHKS